MATQSKCSLFGRRLLGVLPWPRAVGVAVQGELTPHPARRYDLPCEALLAGRRINRPPSQNWAARAAESNG